MTKKLDQEHVDSILELRTEFAKNTNILGNIAIEEYALNSQLTELAAERIKQLDQFEKLRVAETELMGTLKARYGEGQINIEEGTFISAE